MHLNQTSSTGISQPAPQLRRSRLSVRFFQSELRREEQVTCVPESTGAKLMAIVFLAVFGDIPHSEPCLSKILFGGSSEIILQPFSKRAAFKSAYALSISKLTVCLSNQRHHLDLSISCSDGPKKLRLMSRSSLKTLNMPALQGSVSLHVFYAGVKLRDFGFRRHLRPWHVNGHGGEWLIDFKFAFVQIF